MAVYRVLALAVIGLVGSSCGDRPQAGSPVGTWVIVDDSTQSAEYITVSEAQSIRDLNAPGEGGITLSLQGIALREQYGDHRSPLRYIQGFYNLNTSWKSRILLTDSSYVMRPEDVYLDTTEPDSVFAIHDLYSPPSVNFEEHVPSWTTPTSPYAIGSDSAVFRSARFTFRESAITANGSLVFARRSVRPNTETQFGYGRITGRPWVYSMRFNSEGGVQSYGGGWLTHNWGNNSVRSGQWVRSESGEIKVNLGGGDISVYRITVNRWARTMTVVEDTECDRACRSFFATLLDVVPGTLLNIRTEQTRTYRWEENPRPDSLPQPRPPDYVI